MSAYPPEWLCREIVDRAQDAIILADRDGLIRLWNSGAEAMFGYRAEEAVGQTLDLIIPERLGAGHWAGYREVMATGATRYAGQVLAVPAIRKDGASISVEFTIVLLHEPAGTMLGPAAIVRDVTARWEQERALKKRLAALEGRRWGTDAPEDTAGRLCTHPGRTDRSCPESVADRVSGTRPPEDQRDPSVSRGSGRADTAARLSRGLDESDRVPTLSPDHAGQDAGAQGPLIIVFWS